MNKKKRQLAKDTIVFGTGAFGTKILSFLLMPLYTTYLTTSDYGTADIINTSVSLLAVVLTLNISDAVTRFVIEREDQKKSILFFSFRVVAAGSIILGILLFALKKCLGLDVRDYFYEFIFIFFCFSSLNTIMNNYLQASKMLIAVAVSGIIQTFLTLIFNILFLVSFGLGLTGYLLSISIGYCGSIMFETIIIRKNSLGMSKAVNCSGLNREMMRYSIPLIFNSIAWWINTSLDKYFIIAFQGADANGVYSAASKIPNILSTIVTIFLQAWGLSSIREYDSDDKDNFFSNTFSVYNGFCVLFSSCLVLANTMILKILFVKDFYSAWCYSSVLIISCMFSLLSSFAGSIFTAVKDTKAYAFSTILAAVLNCILNIILINLIGTMGAAIATVISFLFVYIMRLLMAKKYINWHLPLFRAFVSYGLLILQVLIEHFEGHMYLAQGMILFILICLYMKDFKPMVAELWIMFLRRDK